MKSINTPPTLRHLLSKWLIIILSGTLIGVGVITIFLLQKILYQQIDHHLHLVIKESAHIVSTHASLERDQLLRQFVTQNGMTIVLLDNQGEVIVETNSPDIAQITEPQLEILASQLPSDLNEPVHFTVTPFRFASLPVVMEGDRGILAVGYSLTVVRNTYLYFMGVLIIGLTLALSASIWGIRFLMNQHLHPLELIAHKAERITTTRNLSLRVETDQETHEVKTLAEAINAMMVRLNNLFIKEHAFFSDAAHSLKTPLAVLRSKIESINLPSEQQKQDLLDTLEQSTDTIQDLLLISRLETEEIGEVESISLSQIMAQTAEIGHILAKDKGITVVPKISSGLIINGNAGLIKRALANIISNAILYTPKKGQISINASSDKNNNYIKILVKDTGIGIGKRDIPKVFDRFYRSKRANNTPGTGLGLAITKAIIKAHQGKIAIKSRLGHGTLVIVELPQK